MEQFTIQLKDKNKRDLLLALLQELKFVEIQIQQQKKSIASASNYDFFQSAGLFNNRNIDSKQLRKQAWGIKN